MAKGKTAFLRRKARALALQVLYEADVTDHPIHASLDWLKEEAEAPEASSSYAMELMEGVNHQRDEIDEFIYRFAPTWPVKQLAVVDRNILRLALFEIHFAREVPGKVAINEAVELAKAFGSESSARFVNGVLGSVMEEIEGISADGSTQLDETGSNGQEGK